MRNSNKRLRIRERLEYELSDIVSDESRLREIINIAKMEQFEETGVQVKGGTGMKKNENGRRGLRAVWKIALIAAALTVVSMGAVLGQEYFSRLYKDVRFEKYQDHLNQAESNAPVYPIDDSKTAEDSKTDAENLVVEWGKYAATSHEAYISVTIKSKDGSPILEESENSVPINTSAEFNALYVTMDGETKKFLPVHRYGEDDSTLTIGEYRKENGEEQIGMKWSGVDCKQFPVNMAEDLSSVTFEIQYSNYDVDLEGKEIEFKLENFHVNYCNFEEIGVQMTMADLLEGKKSGEDKIYFSDKYPECYIDSFGFSSEEEFYDGKSFFYMTVVCDEASKEDMKALAFQSMITGLDAQYETEELEDGKIFIKYAVSRDFAYNEITNGGKSPIDTTEEHLADLILKKRMETEQKIVEGTWSTAFVLKTEPVKIDEKCEVEVSAVNDKTTFVTINHIKVDGMQLVLTGATPDDFDYMKFETETYTPVCTMKDGTVSTLKFNGGSGNDTTHWAQYYYAFPSVVAAEDIAKIEWHDATIWEAR